uniref:Inositol polyphosphate-related phosphatase domain-containing protein n=1 Tax=Aegilops tauschii subsp. strangulata TaxID=200361 RepID=A0A453R525_AEGTS
GGAVPVGVGEEGAGGARGAPPGGLRRPGHHALAGQQGVHRHEHDAAPHQPLLRVQPPGLRREGGRRGPEERRRRRDPQERALPPRMQVLRRPPARPPRADPRARQDDLARGPQLPSLPELRGDEDVAGGERLGRSAGEGPADDREGGGEGVRGLEGGQDQLRADVQVHAELRRVRRRDGQVQEEAANPGMRRCDRILWHGEGIEQLQYLRGESRFSDHRPVWGVFAVEVEAGGGRMRNCYSMSARIGHDKPGSPQRHGGSVEPSS